MAGATLKNRLPQINAELRPRVSRAVKGGAEDIAEATEDRIPVGDESPHIQDRIEVDRIGPGTYGVFVGDDDLYYGRFLEDGTVNMPAQPSLVPTTEEKAPHIVESVVAVLRSL